MPLGPQSFSYEWYLPDGRGVLMRRAVPEDITALRELYFTTYGDRYGLPEVVDDERSREVLTGANYEWLLAECEHRVIASLLFGLETSHRLGKTFGGVVDPSFRGQKIMPIMLREGLSLLLCDGGPFEMVYAVVRTFISLGFHRDLAELGFVDVGIFPNVRKVQRYETHGLKVCLSPTALKLRRKVPVLIPQVRTLYQITRARLNLEPATVVDRGDELPTEERLSLAPRSAGAHRLEFLKRTSRGLKFDFFPLQAPNELLTGDDSTVRAFLNIQARDGHASILGVAIGSHDPVKVLLSVADYCEEKGVAYLELLVSAYEPELQAAAYQAGFIPCAYFPAARRTEHGRREDVIVTSKTFVPLHFRGLKLTEDAKPYILEFFKLYTSHLWEELMEA